jgi:antitoxin component of RelBE/YafQ-DinJ toxin-antitoxin module
LTKIIELIFNIDEDAYKRFSEFCKENGISMSKQVEMFIQSQMTENPKVREEYLTKLDTIRKGRFVKVNDFKKRYLK